MKNEELMKIEAHKKTILLWENELIMNLLQNVDKSMDLYVIDKKWFKDYKNAVFSDKFQDSAKIRNYNSFEPIDYSNIIYNKSTINPISDFVLLNKKSMESFSPKVVPKDYTKMKISVKFLKRKMISRLLSNFFYFYYVDKSNTIKEGFFIFENEEIIKGIINNFLDNDIKDFINQYFKNKNPSLDKNGKIKLYHLNEFDLILKLNEDQYFDRKEIYNIVNLSLDENENNKNKNEVIKNKIYNYKIKENLEYKKKDKSKSKNNNTIIILILIMIELITLIIKNIILEIKMMKLYIIVLLIAFMNIFILKKNMKHLLIKKVKDLKFLCLLIKIGLILFY